MALALPWWAKIGAKVVLSRLQIGYRFWQQLGLFRHGSMDTAEYANDVFDWHVKHAGLGNLKGKTILEIGPGDSIASAVIAYSLGARAILVDSGAYATENIRPYLVLCDLLRTRGLTPPELSAACTLKDALELCNGQYLTAGIESWKTIPSNSVDFVFSHAVLEHVRRNEFLVTQKECFRVMRPGSIASHRVDLKDHLGGGLNNLRFSGGLWESNFFVNSGFYTNRIQFNGMLQKFKDAGFDVKVSEIRRWKELPIQRKKLAAEFREVSDVELKINGFDVLLLRS